MSKLPIKKKGSNRRGGFWVGGGPVM